jgi:hypothetical protein
MKLTTFFCLLGYKAGLATLWYFINDYLIPFIENLDRFNKKGLKLAFQALLCGASRG